MRYTLKIFSVNLTNGEKKINIRSFGDIHDMSQYVVNISEGIAIEFNSSDSESSVYLAHDGTSNTTGNKNYISLVSDQSLLDFCLKKHKGYITINGSTDNYFSTAAGECWKSDKNEPFNEILCDKNEYYTRKNPLNESYKLNPVPQLPQGDPIKHVF